MGKKFFAVLAAVIALSSVLGATSVTYAAAPPSISEKFVLPAEDAYWWGLEDPDYELDDEQRFIIEDDDLVTAYLNAERQADGSWLAWREEYFHISDMPEAFTIKPSRVTKGAIEVDGKKLWYDYGKLLSDEDWLHEKAKRAFMTTGVRQEFIDRDCDVEWNALYQGADMHLALVTIWTPIEQELTLVQVTTENGAKFYSTRPAGEVDIQKWIKNLVAELEAADY